MKGRCATVGTAPAESSATRPAADTGAAPAPASRSGFAVQVGAVNTQAAADKLAADLKSAGFTSYVVKDAGLLKVRTVVLSPTATGRSPPRPGSAAGSEARPSW